MWLINLAPLVREMEMDMEKSEIVGYEPGSLTVEYQEKYLQVL